MGSRRNLVDPRSCLDCKQTFPIREFLVGKRPSIRKRCRPCHSEIQKVKDATPSSQYSRLKVQARERGLVVAMTFEEYTAMRARPCHFCDGPLPIYGVAVDRLDNAGPYSVENCVPSCAFCNTMKGRALSGDEMLILKPGLKEIRERRERMGLPPLMSHLQLTMHGRSGVRGKGHATPRPRVLMNGDSKP